MEFEIYEKTRQFILDEIRNDSIRKEIPEDIFLNYAMFRQNFFGYMGVSGLSNLRDYSTFVERYLEESWPFCCKSDAIIDVESAIAFYVRSKGGNAETQEAIIDYLKSVEVRSVDKIKYESRNFQECVVNYANVVGTTVDAYKADNLYDTLKKLEDKNLPYMEYLILNNIFCDLQSFLKVFDGVCLNCDEFGNLYVSEGNHRVFSYLALLKIREFLGIDSPSENFCFNQHIIFLGNKKSNNLKC